MHTRSIALIEFVIMATDGGKSTFPDETRRKPFFTLMDDVSNVSFPKDSSSITLYGSSFVALKRDIDLLVHYLQISVCFAVS